MQLENRELVFVLMLAQQEIVISASESFNYFFKVHYVSEFLHLRW